jgi:tight adherence protein B
MPPWLLMGLLAIVFTAVMSVVQGIYWAYVARQERAQAELRRRLGAPDGQSETDALFLAAPEDQTARALGGIGNYIEGLVQAADASYSVATVIGQMAILFAVGMMAGGIGTGTPIGMVAGVPAAYIPIFLLQRAGNKRSTELVDQLPDTLELIARSLQAGLGLTDALRMVAEEMPMPVAAEFGRVFEEIRFGRDYREAFGKLVNRNPGVFDLRLLVSSILLQRETGGNLIEILENIADTIRARGLFKAKVKAMVSEAKFSAGILACLPLFVATAITISNPLYLMPLFEETMGNAVVLYVVCSYSLGLFLMNEMSKVEV